MSSGATLGVIMLDTQFPRPPGDAGNPLSWPFPSIYETLPAATPRRVIRRDLTVDELLPPCIGAVQRLVSRGARLITTSCGFLALYQSALQRCSPVPAVASGLIALPAIQSALPAGQVAGVISFDSRELGERHLRAAGADPRTPIVGVQEGAELYRVIRDNLTTLDTRRAAQDMRDAAERLRRGTPNLGAVLLECTNMPPYRALVAKTVRVPVHDILGVVGDAHARLDQPGA